MTSDEFPFEIILGIHRREGKAPEYFVKYKGKSYRNCEFVGDKRIRRLPDGPSFISKAIRSGLPTEEPFYDPDYNNIDKIVEINNNGAIVKWVKLQYDQLTLEKFQTLDQLSLNRYNNITLDSMPTLNEDVTSRFVVPEDFSQNISDLEKITYSYINSSFVDNHHVRILDQYKFRSTGLIAKYIDALLQNPQEKGPFLIVSDIEQSNEWNSLFRDLSPKCNYLSYIGSRENREKIEECDFMLNDNHLKFNILITTPEVFMTENERIKSINWRLVVVDDDQTVRSFKPKHTKTLNAMTIGRCIRIDIASTSSSMKGISSILEFAQSQAGERVFNQDEMKHIAELREALEPLLSAAEHQQFLTAKYNFVNCPLSTLQRAVIQNILLENRGDIENGFYLLSAQKILRVLTHPAIVYKNLDTEPVLASTKFSVLYELISESVKKNEAILIVTQYMTALDLIEDLLIEKSVSYRRFTEDDIGGENGTEIFNEGDICVFLLDNDFAEQIDAPLHIISNVVMLDVPQSSWLTVLRTHRNGRTPTSKVTNVYQLVCADLGERELFTKCTSMTLESADYAGLVIEVALRVNIPENIPKLSKLIEEATQALPANTRLYREDFEEEDFWKMYFESSEKPVISYKQPYIGESKEWTRIERDHLIRWLWRVGAGRFDEIPEFAQLSRTPDEVSLAIRSLIRELLKLTPSTASFPVPRSMLRTDTEGDEIEEQKFMEQEAFQDEAFLNYLKNKAVPLLKRMESLFYLTALFEKSKKPEAVPSLKLAGVFPSKWWTESHDKPLLFAAFRDGLGVYDHILEDFSPNLSYILRNGADVAQHTKLNERIIRLCESAKRLQLSDEKIRENIAQKEFGDWTNEERQAIINVLLRMGIITNDKGESDFEAIQEAAEINRSPREIENYINDLKFACENPGAGNNLSMNVAQKLIQRIKAMDNLRNLLKNLDDDNGPKFFESAPRWRKLSWTPKLEHTFFKQLVKRGFGELQTIIEQPRFDVFDGVIPQFLLSDTSVMKRVEVLVNFKENGGKEKKISKPTHKRDDPSTLKPISIGDIDPETVEYPLMITPSSYILNIGHIVSNRSGWHTSRYIYPAGFKSSKLYASVKNPDDRVVWISEIVDTGKKNPLFKVYMEDDPSVCYTAESPSAPWVCVLKELSKARHENGRANSISGPDAFLLAHPITTYLIQCLPGAPDCAGYVFREVKGAPPRRSTKMVLEDDTSGDDADNDDSDDEKKSRKPPPKQKEEKQKPPTPKRAPKRKAPPRRKLMQFSDTSDEGDDNDEDNLDEDDVM